MNHSPDGGNVLVVAHDAGGAEVVSSWVRRHPGPHYRFVLEGPALGIFCRKLAALTNYPRAELERLVPLSDLVLTSTSHPADLERAAIAVAKGCRIRVASFIDHWVHYPERFQSADAMLLPDEIWVGDEYAAARVKQCFPNITPRLIPNPYFKDLREDLVRQEAPRIADGRLRILYLADSMEERPEHDYGRADVMGFNEFSALENFLSDLQRMPLPAPLGAVRIRLHPVEAPGKYDGVMAAFPDLPVTMSRGTSLAEDCVWADWVVGLFSTAMAVGLLSGRRVFCAIPNPNVACPLPHRDIVRWHTWVSQGPGL